MRKNRLTVTLGLGLLIPCGVSQNPAQTKVTLQSVPPAAGQKPNIILIVSDDFGYGDSGPYGGGVGRGMPTPNIDRLAAEGMTFFSFYAQASCTPGRAAMTYLKYPIRKPQGLSIPYITLGQYELIKSFQEQLGNQGFKFTIPVE